MARKAAEGIACPNWQHAGSKVIRRGKRVDKQGNAWQRFYCQPLSGEPHFFRIPIADKPLTVVISPMPLYPIPRIGRRPPSQSLSAMAPAARRPEGSDTSAHSPKTGSGSATSSVKNYRANTSETAAWNAASVKNSLASIEAIKQVCE